MRKIKYNFCMSQFKPAIGALTILVVLVIGWSTWNFRHERRHIMYGDMMLTAAVKPPAASIKVNDKMVHPYWGNCNKCHITVDAPATAVSKVFAGPPLSINAPMTHDYWGNCNLCHQVTDGFRPAGANGQLAAATVGGAPPISSPNVKALHPDWGPCDNCHQITGGQNPAAAGQPAAFNQVEASTLGIKVEAVNAAQMQLLGLASEDGMLVLAVALGSIADRAGLQQGDEMIRINNIRLETLADFNTALSLIKPGQTLKVNIFRGKKSRNLFFEIPENLPQNLTVVAANAPLVGMGMGIGSGANGQMQLINTPQMGLGIGNGLNGQMQLINKPQMGLGIGNGLNGQMQLINTPNTQQARVAAMTGGKVAVGVEEPHLNSQVSPLFESSPYFIILDPAQNNYQVVGNPNYNDLTGGAVQTGQYIADLGVNNIVAGSYSSEAYQTLNGLRINMYAGVTGTASSALLMYTTGQLQASTSPPPEPLANVPVRQPLSPNTPNTLF